MNDITNIAVCILVVGAIPSLVFVGAFWIYVIGTVISVKGVNDEG